MKDKRIIAMFISSIFAFIASVSISVGVAFAFADPVIATGLAELTYNVSDITTRTIVFDPVAEFNEDVDAYILRNSYDEIYYANESIVDDIRLAKIVVSNDTHIDTRFVIHVDVDGYVNAVDYARVAVFDLTSGQTYRFASGETTAEIDLGVGQTKRFILAGYVKTTYATEEVDFSAPMDMIVSVAQVNV